MPTDLEPSSPAGIKRLPPEPPLPCLVCNQAVVKDEWFLIVAQATETLRTGSPYEASYSFPHVAQRPVHFVCLSRKPVSG